MGATQTFSIKQDFFIKRHITVHVDRIHDKNLIRLCEKIETFFFSAESEILKNDHSSTVIKAVSSGSVFVIKRDNPGNILKYSRRIFKKSRSFKVWRKTEFLRSESLDTLCPLALVEDYAGFVRVHSFVVSEYINGPTLEEILCCRSSSREKIRKVSQKAVTTLEKWHEKGVSHQDPKAKNIILQHGRLYFIDTEDLSTPRLKITKRKKFSRDIAIMLYNFRNHKEIKDILLKDICNTYDLGLHFLAGELITKFWKTEFPILLKTLEDNGQKPSAVDKIPFNRTLSGWEKTDKTERHKTYVSNAPPFETLITYNPFFTKKKLKTYFTKKPGLSCGILSMTLRLRICGFNLPEITECGIKNKTEYLVYQKSPDELTFADLWFSEKRDPVAETELLHTLGNELGRFHAMGFIHKRLSLHNIYIKITKRGYEIVFPPSPFIKRIRRKSLFGLKSRGEIIEKELLSFSSKKHADLFAKAHERMVQKK